MKKLYTKLIRTNDDILPFSIRLVLGIVMFGHGAQKMLGIFGGHGVEWTLQMWERWFGFPYLITALVVIGEFFGSILLITGLFTRIAGLVIVMIMLGAIYFVHFKWGFYMNWYNEEGRGEGVEYHLLVLTMCLALIIRGGGRYSVDHIISRNQ